jgi:hypothetical protein
MYKALKSFDHDQLGRIEKGQKFEATDAQVGGVKLFVEKIPVVAGDNPKVNEKTKIKRRTKKAE